MPGSALVVLVWGRAACEMSRSIDPRRPQDGTILVSQSKPSCSQLDSGARESERMPPSEDVAHVRNRG